MVCRCHTCVCVRVLSPFSPRGVVGYYYDCDLMYVVTKKAPSGAFSVSCVCVGACVYICSYISMPIARSCAYVCVGDGLCAHVRTVSVCELCVSVVCVVVVRPAGVSVCVMVCVRVTRLI